MGFEQHGEARVLLDADPLDGIHDDGDVHVLGGTPVEASKPGLKGLPGR
ncbi:LEPR-XLL domain-containing protein [Aquimonas voraii]